MIKNSALIGIILGTTYGSSIYVVRNDSLYSIDVGTKSERSICAISTKELSIDLAEETIAYVKDSNGERHIYLKKIRNGTETKVDKWSNQNYGPEISPNGKKVLFNCLGAPVSWKICLYDQDKNDVEVFPGLDYERNPTGINGWVNDSLVSFYTFESRRIYNANNKLYLSEAPLIDSTNYWFGVPGSKVIDLYGGKEFLINGVNANSDPKYCDGPCDNLFYVDSTKKVFTLFPNGYQVLGVHVSGNEAFATTSSPKKRIEQIFKINLITKKTEKLSIKGILVDAKYNAK